jgi:hypothetical protein
MAPRPWRPHVELEAALDRGDLDFAKALVPEVGRPVPLDLAARFLPLVAAADGDYDAWARRWLMRWLSEAQRPSIETAAELAATLADLRAERADASVAFPLSLPAQQIR